MMRPAISWLCKLTNFKNDIEMLMDISAYAQTKRDKTNGIKSDRILREFNNSNLSARVSIDPILIIKNEIIANPMNSIKEIITRITDIRMIKEVSALDIMELID